MGACVGRIPEAKPCFRCGSMQSRQKTVNHVCTIQKPIIEQKKLQMQTPQPQLVLLNQKAVPDPNQRMKIKVPKDNSKTKFQWKSQQALFYPANTKNIPRQIIKNGTFQQKLAWFRINLEKLRISWEKGSSVLKVDRWNILFSSLQGLKDINLYKQLKIEFTDEKVDDAGGLLRQWMHLCNKQIFSKQTGIFQQCQTDETAYKFVWDNNVVEQIALQTLNLLGLIIGKALFQRISLNCYLDRTILRQLCSQPVHIQDVYSYDKALYQSCMNTLKMKNAAQLHLDGCVYHNHGQNDLEQIELFPNGKNTMITNQNRSLYITQMIHLYCTKSIQKYLKALTTSVYKIIPAQLLSIFQPHQLELVLNGPFIIDAKDWKNHTIYQGYKPTDQIIKWFWENVSTYNQQSLKNLLHYCTGSGRVPVLGFKYLQSNRGEVRPFTIRRIQYRKENPYPKSHTCFNRLQLPAYTTKQELSQRMEVLAMEELNHFGLG